MAEIRGEDVLERLGRSAFRARFRLGPKERAYLRERGLDVVAEQARVMLRRRLGEAQPRNDGKQTPMRGHPVFVAQHATATCCRSCLRKWHGVAMGRPLTGEEIASAAAVIRAWLEREAARSGLAEGPTQPGLFEQA